MAGRGRVCGAAVPVIGFSSTAELLIVVAPATLCAAIATRERIMLCALTDLEVGSWACIYACRSTMRISNLHIVSLCGATGSIPAEGTLWFYNKANPLH